MSDNRKAKAIIKEVAEGYRIPVKEILGKSRLREVVTARRAALIRLKEETSMSISEIARTFNTDYASAKYHIDPDFRCSAKLRHIRRESLSAI